MYSKEEQIEAMIDGNLPVLFKTIIDDPLTVDIRKYINVTRIDIINYFNMNENGAMKYFQKYKTNICKHDVVGIDFDNNKYYVFWYDHGDRRFIKEFDSMVPAVSEHLLIRYGMY